MSACSGAQRHITQLAFLPLAGYSLSESDVRAFAISTSGSCFVVVARVSGMRTEAGTGVGEPEPHI